MPITQELSEYIKKAREAGMSDGTIRDELLKSGWQVSDVNAVIPPPVPNPPQPILQTPFQGGSVSETKPPIEQTKQSSKGSEQQPSTRPHHSRTPFVITVVLLLAVGGVTYYFLPQIVTYADKLLGKGPAELPFYGEMPFDEGLITPDIIVDEPMATTTEEWVTYKDEKYGFEFTHPSSWLVKHWKGDKIFYICNEELAAYCGPLPEGVIANVTLTFLGDNNVPVWTKEQGDTTVINRIISSFIFTPETIDTQP